MKPRQVALALLDPQRFTENEQRAACLLASDFVERVQRDLSLLIAQAKECEQVAQILRSPYGQSEANLIKARRFAADLVKEDLWRDAERLIERLGRRGNDSYFLQPPVFESTRETCEMIASEGGCIYRDGKHLIFGFPGASLGEALVRALRIRQKTGEEIAVGAKADERHDDIFSRLQDRIWQHRMPGVSFINLDGYASVYCRDPGILLQPELRKRRGLREYPLPGREEHNQAATQIRAFLRESRPVHTWLSSQCIAVLRNDWVRLRSLDDTRAAESRRGENEKGDMKTA